MILFLPTGRVLFLAAAITSLIAPAQAQAQEKPLERQFVTGESASYRIQLKVRIEIEGQQTSTIGAKTYVQPVTRRAEAEISWIATRKILSVDPQGSAEVEEALSDIDRTSLKDSGETGSVALQEALREPMLRWPRSYRGWPSAAPLVLRYHETRFGQLQGLRPEGVPPLDEAPTRLVSLWLLRALRPTCPLPDRPIRLGEPWQEPRAAQLENWDDVRAAESGAWLEMQASAVPALRLHTTQQISGRVTSGSEKPPEGAAQGNFHGESLSTVSLEDGRLLAATRSASRTITWMLEPVEGLPERPQFRGRLSVEVQIQSCDENTCPAADRHTGRGPR